MSWLDEFRKEAKAYVARLREELEEVRAYTTPRHPRGKMKTDEAREILEDVLDTLTEVGNGATDEDLWGARGDLFRFRDEWFKDACVALQQADEALAQLIRPKDLYHSSYEHHSACSLCAALAAIRALGVLS